MNRILAFVMAFACACALTTQAATLKVGDAAPKLQTGKWVQGDPVKDFDKNHAYIVEFWATWCGPCRVSIPHLNEIHTKFKDKGLIVIGQNVWERDEKQVQPFIEKMGDKMTYRVAMDDKTTSEKGTMAETWMEAAGQNGIPAAFVVGKDGRIAWIGHPMQLKETIIEEVLAGKFDLKKAAAEQEKQQEQEAEQRKLSQELNKQIQAKDWVKAEAALDEIAKTLPADERSRVEAFRLRILLMSENYERAGKLAEKVAEGEKEAEGLNGIAWMLATTKGIKGPALDAAAKIAAKANTAADGKDAGILDTMARIAFMQGQKDKAIELQQKAVGLAEGDTKKDLEATLASYKEGKLPDVD